MAATASHQPLPIAEVLQYAIINARRSNNLAKGLNECSRNLEQATAVLCVASMDIRDQHYAELVPVLCNENDIPLMTVNDSQTLATWAGQGQLDQEGEPHRINTNGCSVIVIRRWDSSDRNIRDLMDYIKRLQDARRG